MGATAQKKRFFHPFHGTEKPRYHPICAKRLSSILNADQTPHSSCVAPEGPILQECESLAAWKILSGGIRMQILCSIIALNFFLYYRVQKEKSQTEFEKITVLPGYETGG